MKKAVKTDVPQVKWKAWVENGEALFLSGVVMNEGPCQILSEKLLRKIVREEIDRPKKKR